MNRTPRALAILAFTLLAGASLPAATAHAKVYVYSCVLSPKQETPPTASSGAGGGYFVIDTDANQVKYWISFGGLTSPENAAHIHGFAAPGIGGGILTSLPAGNPKIGTWNYTEPQEASILAHPLRAGLAAHAGRWFDLRVMLTPWGVGLLGGLITPRSTFPMLIITLMLAYGQLLVATDSVRLYQWAAPPLILATISVVPPEFAVVALLVHLLNPWSGDGGA